MPPRIASDPNADACPEFASADWAAVRRELALPGETDKQTALRLAATWAAINARQRLLWAAQVASDAAAGGPNGARAPEAAQPKPNVNLPAFTLNLSRAAPDRPTYVPSRYAIDRLANFEYVELWYFTHEGRQRSLAIEGLAASDVLPDADLTWSQMSVGMITMLDEMKKCAWPADAVDAVAALYRALDAHPCRFRAHGETDLLRYQASVRRSWYDSFRGGEAFNIGLFNETLLENISSEHLRNLQVAAMAEVSPARSSHTTAPLSISPVSCVSYIIPVSLPTRVSASRPHAAPCRRESRCTTASPATGAATAAAAAPHTDAPPPPDSAARTHAPPAPACPSAPCASRAGTPACRGAPPPSSGTARPRGAGAAPAGRS